MCAIPTERFQGDPRFVLKKVVKRAADMGYVMEVKPECEFFLFHSDEEGRPTIRLMSGQDILIRSYGSGRECMQGYCDKSGGNGFSGGVQSS